MILYPIANFGWGSSFFILSLDIRWAMTGCRRPEAPLESTSFEECFDGGE